MQRKILLIDDHDDLASAMEEVFAHTGHTVQIVDSRSAALSVERLNDFDLVITDLDVSPDDTSSTVNGSGKICMVDLPDVVLGEHVKAFKVCAANFGRDDDYEDDLKNMTATVLDYKSRYVDRAERLADLHEKIEFELPSSLSLMHIVLEYLVERVEKLGVCKSEDSNLFVALDEAFVNAVKHGNKYDASKLIRISADVSPEEAKFVIEDEGEGFDVNAIPDPLDPANLFKTSGRGVLFIYNIMDEVTYNSRGNRLTMVKKAPQTKEEPVIRKKPVHS
jgi:serine/threonine-protein kinase RsbW